MDLGTVLLPFIAVRATKVADKETVEPNGILTYTIRVSNAGTQAVEGGNIRIFDTLDANVQYVADSTVLIMDGDLDNAIGIDDDISGETVFPIDETGFLLMEELRRRGGIADIQFQVMVAGLYELNGTETILNTGYLKQQEDEQDDFETETDINYEYAEIEITNTVYLGEDDAGASCTTAVEYVEDYAGEPVIYCFNVTNTGATYLNTLIIEAVALLYDPTEIVGVQLAPGESTLVTVPATITGDLNNTAVVTGNPLHPDGTDIAGRCNPRSGSSFNLKLPARRPPKAPPNHPPRRPPPKAPPNHPPRRPPTARPVLLRRVPPLVTVWRMSPPTICFVRASIFLSKL